MEKHMELNKSEAVAAALGCVIGMLFIEKGGELDSFIIAGFGVLVFCGSFYELLKYWEQNK